MARRPRSYAMPKEASPPFRTYSVNAERYSASKVAAGLVFRLAGFFMRGLRLSAPPRPARRHSRENIFSGFCRRLVVEIPGRKGLQQNCREPHRWQKLECHLWKSEGRRPVAKAIANRRRRRGAVGAPGKLVCWGQRAAMFPEHFRLPAKSSCPAPGRSKPSSLLHRESREVHHGSDPSGK